MGQVAIETGRRPMPFRRKLLWSLLALLAILLGAAAVTLAPVLFERNTYAHVASIERRADFRDPQLMAAAWTLPAARLYDRRAYEYQDNPSFCGPASLTNVLHSMGRHGSQRSAIDGTRFEPWFGVLIGGMTIDEFAALARERTGRPVTIFRRPTLDEFQALMHSANDPAFRYVANFHRGPLFGRGHGHFSPILGYLESRDLVLVGDVNADYRPFLVNSERLWRATNTIDSATGNWRGIVRIEADQPGANALR